MFSKISSILFLFLFLFSTHFFSRIFCQEFSLPKTSSQLREEGDKALREGDTKKAIHLYTEGIRIDPKDHHTFYKRAIVRLSTYQTQKALDDLNAVLELKPTFTQVIVIISFKHKIK